MAMSALDQKQTFRSAKGHVRFTPYSDIDCVFRHVCFGPIADIARASWPLTAHRTRDRRSDRFLFDSSFLETHTKYGC
jgi:hypothetical protein